MTPHRILVVGTNVALLAISIAERLHCHVVALLPDASLLDVVRARAQTRGVDNLITFEIGGISELGYARDAFSAVVAKSLRPAPGSFLELDELVRVLRPEGTFAAIEDIDEWSSGNAIGFAMDLWHGLLSRYQLERFEIHVARFADIYLAQKRALH